MDLVIDWYNNGHNIKEYKRKKKEIDPSYNSALAALGFILKPHISWSFISSGSFRYYPSGFVFDVQGSSVFLHNQNQKSYVHAFLNSKITNNILSFLNPTLSLQPGNVKSLPFIESSNTKEIEKIEEICVSISKSDWKSRENSWSFECNELIKQYSNNLEELYDIYRQYWKKKFFTLHKNEVELNRQFIKIFGLQEELTPDVPLEDITILKEETSIVNGQLVFNQEEVFSQFISYAVGCMFGRYSLDKEGLILANQGETLQDYLVKS